MSNYWNHLESKEQAHGVVEAESPETFITQHAAPLFYQPTAASRGSAAEFHSEQEFWKNSKGITFSSVTLEGFRLSDWFPRAPGVYWSQHGMRARELAWLDDTTNDPELGLIFSPRSKMSLIEEGGIGTIRLRPRRIESTDCWFATAVKGSQCAGGIPLVFPHSFLKDGKIAWGDTAIFRGTVRFLQDAGLDDTAAYVHHATPLIVFVENVESLPNRERSTAPIIVTPAALFERISNDRKHRRRWGSEFGYTFVQCGAGCNRERDDPAGWIERYAQKHGGRIITNFDEQSPILSNAPLSYQRLIQKTYDRTIIKNFHLEKLGDRIDLAVGPQYYNHGTVGAMGENARSNNNNFWGDAGGFIREKLRKLKFKLK